MNATVAVILALAAGRYACRPVGPAPHGRVQRPARVRETAGWWLGTAAVWLGRVV
jgi:hypothetical protein